MRALLDTNIILDCLLMRQPWGTQASILWQAARSRSIECCVTASSITDIYYVSDQFLRQQPIPGTDARQIIRRCLDCLAVLDVGRSEIERAYQIAGRDLEDDLQRACAEHHRLDAIVTRDAAGFQGTSIPVHTAESYVEHLIQNGTIPRPTPFDPGPTT
jgi:predicted nucleic acid-binding protein